MNLILPLSATDFTAFADFFIQNNKLHSNEESVYFNSKIEPKDLVEHFNKIMDDSKFIAFKYIESDKIIGIIYGYHYETKQNFMLLERSYVQIQNLFVRNEYRNRGIGKELISHFESECKLKGIYEIELIVWEFNQSAINLYSKLGYETKLQRMSKSIYN